MFRAAPKANGIESATPSTVATTVIVRLSSTPLWMNCQRDTKSGRRKPAKTTWARSMPNTTRFQLTSMVANARYRYVIDPRRSP